MAATLKAMLRGELLKLKKERGYALEVIETIGTREKQVRVLLASKLPRSKKRAVSKPSGAPKRRTEPRSKRVIRNKGMVFKALEFFRGEGDQGLTTQDLTDKLAAVGYPKIPRRRGQRSRTPRAVLGGWLAQQVKAGYIERAKISKDRKGGGQTFRITSLGEWRHANPEADNMAVAARRREFKAQNAPQGVVPAADPLSSNHGGQDDAEELDPGPASESEQDEGTAVG